MYIRKHGYGYRVEVEKHGQRASAIKTTRREARDWGLKKEAELEAMKGRGHALAKAIERYLETVSPQKRGAVGWETRRFAELEAHFGVETPLADIDSDGMARFRDKLLKRVSGSTVVRYFNLYRNLFSIARDEWRWIDRSPFTGLKLPKENIPRKAKWGWREIRHVLREGQKRGGKTGEVVLAFHIALHTSMRLQECLDFSFDQRRKVIGIPPSKASLEPEEIPMLPRAFRFLQKHPRHFTVDANEASTLFSDLCRQLLIKKLQFRDSRATALTWLSRKVDILTLARISRHKDIDLLRSTYYRETAEEISRRLGYA